MRKKSSLSLYVNAQLTPLGTVWFEQSGSPVLVMQSGSPVLVIVEKQPQPVEEQPKDSVDEELEPIQSPSSGRAWWGWIEPIAPYLKAGGRPGAVILALAIAAIPLGFATGTVPTIMAAAICVVAIFSCFTDK